MEKKISHIEVYYEDTSMERVSNEKAEDKKLTKKQINWIIKNCLNELDSIRDRTQDEREVTIDNYNSFNENVFSDLPHSEYLMVTSILDSLNQ